MTGYAIDPTSPIHKKWTDENGPIRVLCEPAEGYVMIRRPGAMPGVISVRDLLCGKYTPVLKKRGKPVESGEKP
jgi:hypothetical protein